MLRHPKSTSSSRKTKSQARRTRWLACEQLEDRRLMIMGAVNPVPAVPAGEYSGVANLSYGKFDGSAVVLTGGRHVLTAAHVVDTNDDGAVDPGFHTLRFQKGKNQFDELKVLSSQIEIHQGWDAKHIENGNDIALITLNTTLPSYITRYDIYAAPDEGGKVFDMVGWGNIGTGLKGAKPNADKLYQGQNIFKQPATKSNQLFHDLDDPRVAGATNLRLEATIGSGDSGGPAFIGGRVAGIASYSVGMDRLGMTSSHTRVSSFASWIDARTGRSRISS